MPEFSLEAYDTFWYWIAERHNIFLKKCYGESKPWTKDPILQEWKFCNPFRKNDAQTRNLQNIIQQHPTAPAEMVLFNIFLFRAFNLLTTYDALGWQEHWDSQYSKTVLWNRTVNQGLQLTSGAYMLRGREGMPKYESIVQSLDQIWQTKEHVTDLIMEFGTLEGAWKELCDAHYWGWGPFTIYQVVLDLWYTRILNQATDYNEWCCFGPGAKKGLELIWPGIKPFEYLDSSKILLGASMTKLPNSVPEMNLQDIEFSLCELGKYMRIKSGGHGKERYNGRS